jgi:hypothetical protein
MYMHVSCSNHLVIVYVRTPAHRHTVHYLRTHACTPPHRTPPTWQYSPPLHHCVQYQNMHLLETTPLLVGTPGGAGGHRVAAALGGGCTS